MISDPEIARIKKVLIPFISGHGFELRVALYKAARESLNPFYFRAWI